MKVRLKQLAWSFVFTAISVHRLRQSFVPKTSLLQFRFHHSFSSVSTAPSVLFPPLIEFCFYHSFSSVFTTLSVLLLPHLEFCFYYSFSSVSTTASVLFNHYLAFVPNYHTLRDKCPSTAASNLARRWGLSPTDQPRKDPFDSPFTSASTTSRGHPSIVSQFLTLLSFRFYTTPATPFPVTPSLSFPCSFTSVSITPSLLFTTNFLPFHHSFGSFPLTLQFRYR